MYKQILKEGLAGATKLILCTFKNFINQTSADTKGNLVLLSTFWEKNTVIELIDRSLKMLYHLTHAKLQICN